MTTKKTTRITVSFSENEYSALEAIARQQDASMSWVVRRAVSEYFEHHTEPKQEEMLLKSDKLKKAQ
ncbi:ribbon-helix-helix protein, CopG family [Gynuella sunshinyii]|uniref:ribbon-helix-helix protein, CopG family n=1 Tax=Gynuella sunshinyii TaxID=1445505 RepID=UPI0005CC7D61|nr:ribbon-helix-helix protein, CopG family [Gynuella sunshinyii]